MTGPSRAERIRKEARKFSDLAESAPSAFLRDYYQRIAERYPLPGERMETGWTAGKFRLAVG
jgi:hypothetical protein